DRVHPHCDGEPPPHDRALSYPDQARADRVRAAHGTESRVSLPSGLPLLPVLLCLLGAGLAVTWVLAPPGAPAAPSPSSARRAREPLPGVLETARLVEQLATVLATGTGLRQAWAAM